MPTTDLAALADAWEHSPHPGVRILVAAIREHLAPPTIDQLPHDPEVWDHPAYAPSVGTTDTSVLVRYPSGDVIPVGVQRGFTARTVALGLAAVDGYTVTGARRTLSSGVVLAREVVSMP